MMSNVLIKVQKYVWLKGTVQAMLDKKDELGNQDLMCELLGMYVCTTLL